MDDGTSGTESSWYSPNPVCSAPADAESGGGNAWGASAPLTLEREPAPYSMHDTMTAAGDNECSNTDSDRSDRVRAKTRQEQVASRRLGLFELVRTALCVFGLFCVLSVGLQPRFQAATDTGVRPSAALEVELQGCRRTVASLRSRVGTLESTIASTQTAQTASVAASASEVAKPRITQLLSESEDSHGAYDSVSEQLSKLHAEIRLTKMTTWDEVGSGAADAEEEAHAAQTLGGEGAAAINVAKSRRIAVRSAFVRAYKSYETFAFGYDDLKPLRMKGEDWLGMGATIVDSLDTMLLMGLGSSPQYYRAREWVSTSLDLAPNRDISVFETSIRVLGGLLAAHSLTADSLYLQKAETLGANLLFAFNTKTGIPSSTVNLAQGMSRRKMTNPL